MNHKEEIRNSPFLVHVSTRIHYYGVEQRKYDLFIEIEIIEKKEKITLSSEGISGGKYGNYIQKYDNQTSGYFYELIQNFGKINIKLFDGKKDAKTDFNNYEEFLDEITSD